MLCRILKSLGGGALLAVAASAALSIGAWAEPIRPRLIDEIGEATFTSLARFRPGRDGVERLSVSVQTVDEQQRPVKFFASERSTERNFL